MVLLPVLQLDGLLINSYVLTAVYDTPGTADHEQMSVVAAEIPKQCEGRQNDPLSRLLPSKHRNRLLLILLLQPRCLDPRALDHTIDYSYRVFLILGMQHCTVRDD
jgi:hypothetical protein